MIRNIVIVIVVIILIVLGFWLFSGDTKNENEASPTTSPSGTVQGDNSDLFDYKSTLLNVSSNSGLAQATGNVMAGFIDGTYRLEAKFENLPVPEQGTYYQGWLVQNYVQSLAGLATTEKISTGRIEFEKGGALNIFTSNTDLTDYTFYFLTLESNIDGVSTSNKIMEGELKK